MGDCHTSDEDWNKPGKPKKILVLREYATAFTERDHSIQVHILSVQIKFVDIPCHPNEANTCTRDLDSLYHDSVHVPVS